MATKTATKQRRAPSPASAEGERLKRVIRRRWTDPARAAAWHETGLNADFGDPASRRAWRAALRQAVPAAGDALDLGTGPGTIAQLWAELGHRTTGVDFSPAMVAAARASAQAKDLAITFIEGDAEAPPVGRRRFDVISSRFVLFTLPHPGYAVRRWVELLKPGGAIVLIGHDKPRVPPPGASDRNAGHAARAPGAADLRHQRALARLPFVHHGVGELQVLLEAVGLRGIRRLPLDRLIAARAAFAAAHAGADGAGAPRHGAFAVPPFVIVGYR